MVAVRLHLLRCGVLAAILPWLMAADARQSLWDRLDPVRRTQVLMALLGLLLLGFLMMMLVLVGARQVRRLARQRPSKGSLQNRLGGTTRPPRDDAADADDEMPPEEPRT